MRLARCSFGRHLAVIAALACVAGCGSVTEGIVVLTADGGVFIGQVESADRGAVVIRDAEGALHAIDRDTIVSMGRAADAETRADAADEPDPSPPDGTNEPDPPPPAPVQTHREIVVPVGTVLRVALDQPVATATSVEGDAVYAHVTAPVQIEGIEVVSGRGRSDRHPRRGASAWGRRHPRTGGVRIWRSAPVPVGPTDGDRDQCH